MPDAFDDDLQRMLEEARHTPRLPEQVRARTIARARTLLTPAAPAPSFAATRIRSVRFALAVLLGLTALAVGAAVGAIATLRGRAPRAALPSPAFTALLHGPNRVGEPGQQHAARKSSGEYRDSVTRFVGTP